MSKKKSKVEEVEPVVESEEARLDALFGDAEDQKIAEPEPPAEAPAPAVEEPAEAPAAPVSEPAEPEPIAAEVEAEVEEAQPEPETLEQLQARIESAERAAHAMRRDLWRAKDRARRAEAALAERRQAAEPPAEAERIPIEVDEEGRWSVPAEAIEKVLAQRGTPTAPPPAPPVEDYAVTRARILDSYGEQKAEVEQVATRLETAFAFLDQSLGEEARATGMTQADLASLGYVGTVKLFRESGIADEFRRQYPDVSMTEVLLAAYGEDQMRAAIDSHIGRVRARSQEVEETAATSEPPRLARPPMPARPQPMAQRGRHRSPDAEPEPSVEDLFDMSDADFKEYERRSAARLLRSARRT